MIQVLRSAWPLLLGIGLLMVGNGLQGTLLGVRGGIEGFATWEMSIVMSAYFLGFLGGSRLTPELIRRVGHVRVFAALGSFISAVLILYPTITEAWAWALLRVIIGFCFSGVYVTAESWLNNAATNENRGQALSLYMIVQMAGVVTAQGILVLGDPSGFILFIVPSVLVSISFAPILLSVNPTPAFGTTKPMSLIQLYRYSPLGVVGMTLMGGVFSAQFGMASVYATQIGLSVGEISLFISLMYIGGLSFQYPIGWLSDRFDRRMLVMYAAVIGGIAAVLGTVLGHYFGVLLLVAFLVGGMSNPLYSLLIAYTNDYLEHDDMAAASGGLMFVNGLGAIIGPIVTGWMMGAIGPRGFWLFIAVLMGATSLYALYRMTQRAAPSSDETDRYVPVLPTSSPVALSVAQEWAVESAETAESADEQHNAASSAA
ncbi:MFS transporter [Mesobaculum littorinae]|uniref:MFS transporter n=1 Tax=Mesobaculum littorinae TaxID=2486419 RepID=A0A438ALD2_9RHOB|nr:MFS transporter [Mesobaculum littorinae]RVV99444.1 MFS transporter [Mesobaculum littorinae]